MNEQEKPNAEKESELTRLKEKWRTLDESERDHLRELLASKSTLVQKCHEIAARLNIMLIYYKQLYRFRDWVEDQDARMAEAENMAEDERWMKEHLGDSVPLEKIREYVLRLSYNRSVSCGNFPLALRTMSADQKERALQLNWEKYEFDAAEKCDKKLPKLKLISNNPKLSHKEKINQIRLELFGKIAPPQL